MFYVKIKRESIFEHINKIIQHYVKVLYAFFLLLKDIHYGEN